MGYDTQFEGRFELDRPLAQAHYEYIRAFAEARHMRLHTAKVAELADPLRKAARLPVGREGVFYLGENPGAYLDPSFVVRDDPPTVVGLENWGRYCHWTSEDGQSVEYDGSEKFEGYAAWLEFVLVNFLARWRYVANGVVGWEGEDGPEEVGVLIVVRNALRVAAARPRRAATGRVDPSRSAYAREDLDRVEAAYRLGGVKAAREALARLGRAK